MLVAAVNWSPEWKKKSRERVLSTPRTAHYIAGWPRDTDLGVIAEGNGQRPGAAWLRFLPASDPGYGFVASDVPELTVGVAASWRGRGVGRVLLRAIADQARSTGIDQQAGITRQVTRAARPPAGQPPAGDQDPR
jgi:GNAT superfamily N-acetyltransferase